MWKLLLLFHLQVAFGGCQFIRTPLNTAVIVGQRLELVCQPNSNFTIREWKIQRLEGISSPIFGNWRNSRFEDRRFGFEIDNDSSVVIYLNSTELDDAGIYSCHIHAGTQRPRQHNAQVIVFEREPFCEEVIPTYYNVTLKGGNVIWMRCKLNFRGNVAPAMEWRHHGVSGEIDGKIGRVIKEMVETTIIPDTSISMISSTLTIAINLTYNATFFTCKIYSQWDNASSPISTATNAPHYSYTWNSSAIIFSATTFVPKETLGLSWLTAVNLCILVLSICVCIVTISICIVNRRKFKAGSNEKAEETTADSNPDDYQNVTTDASATIDDSQAATYMELTSLTQESLSNYTSIDIAGRMLTMPRTPSPDYENMTDI